MVLITYNQVEERGLPHAALANHKDPVTSIYFEVQVLKDDLVLESVLKVEVPNFYVPSNEI